MNRDSVAVLLATWERDVAEAGPLNKKDLRPERFIADLKAALTREAAPQASGGDDPMRLVRGQARAWEAVVEVLDKAVPDWNRADGTCAMDRACRLIRRLATTDSAIQPQQGATGGARFHRVNDALRAVGVPATDCPHCDGTGVAATGAGSAPVGVDAKDGASC